MLAWDSSAVGIELQFVACTKPLTGGVVIL
jgi:hypothetical protein